MIVLSFKTPCILPCLGVRLKIKKCNTSEPASLLSLSVAFCPLLTKFPKRGGYGGSPPHLLRANATECKPRGQSVASPSQSVASPSKTKASPGETPCKVPHPHSRYKRKFVIIGKTSGTQSEIENTVRTKSDDNPAIRESQRHSFARIWCGRNPMRTATPTSELKTIVRTKSYG